MGTVFEDVPTDDPAATGVVGLAGGTIAGVTADGQEYQLIVPRGALADPVEISVQPLERGGPPFGDEVLFAYDLQPEGLTFSRPAYLVVNTPGRSHDGVVGIGAFGDDGQAFPRRASTIGSAVVLEIWHFSSARADAGQSPGEQMAWAEEVARAFTPSTLVAEEGARYGAAVDAANQAIIARATPDGAVDEAAIAANLRSWLNDRIEGHLLAVGGRSRLVQALAELDRVRVSAMQMPTGVSQDEVLADVALTDELVRQAWQAMLDGYLAPDCSAPLLDATDAFQHPMHIRAVAENHGWDGFDLPLEADGWCAQVRIEQLDVPDTVPDEQLTTSAETVAVSMRYAIRTPRPPAFPGEPIGPRFDGGPLRLAERLDLARACVRVIDATGTVGGEPESCTDLAVGQDTFAVDVDPSGLADLVVEAELRIRSIDELVEPTTRRATALRLQRTLELTTPSVALPAPPATAPVCAVVREVTSAGDGPVAGVPVELEMTAAAGSTGSFPAVSGTTDADGRLCGEYSYDRPARPASGSSAVIDLIEARWTDHLGQARTTPLLVEPDWVDLRLWRTGDGRSFDERINAPAPTSFAFTDSRFTDWQAAVVRRAASPADPDRAGARAVTPDGGVSGTFEAGGGIHADWGSSNIAVGGQRTGPVGIDLLGEAQPTAAFRVCVCYEAYSAGDTTLAFSASLDGQELRHDLTLSWPRLTSPPDPPPPPPPPPEPDPDGVTRVVRYAPERVVEPGTYRYDGGIQAVTFRTSEGLLYHQVDIEVDGVAVSCPRIDVVGIFESYCGSFSNAVNGIGWTISGGSSIISYADDPRPFVVRSTVGSLDAELGWVVRVFETTIVPGDDPNTPPPPSSGPGSPGWSDDCLDEQAHVHALEDPNNCNCA